MRRAIQSPTKFSDSAHSSLRSFLSTFSPLVQGHEQHLLQPITEAYYEPLPLALLGTHFLSFITTYPDIITL